MGDEEKRAIRAAALLEYEDARENLALLRAKATHLISDLDRVRLFMVRMLRDVDARATAISDSRSEIVGIESRAKESLNLNALLALDETISDAFERMKTAQKIKSDLGFPV